MKTSKVTNASPVMENNQHAFFDTKSYGRFFKYDIAFENGDAGVLNVKNGYQCKFVVGNVGYYSIPEAGKIKLEDPDYQNQGGQQQQSQQPQQQHVQQQAAPAQQQQQGRPRNSIEIQCCIKSACDFHEETGATADDVIKSADKFYNWMNGKG